jgi:hypothetical protein
MASSTTDIKKLKILGVGAGNKPVPKMQKVLKELGYDNMKIFGIYNTKESDQEFLKALKEKEWDAVCIGS